MHRLWEPVISALVHAAAPRAIVEIGSDHGFNTLNLLAYCREAGARLAVIDPLPKYDVEAWRKEWGAEAAFHLSLSLNALPKIAAMDLVLIDGDHNWHTVLSELSLIWKSTVEQAAPFPLVLLHDVGWPYGRRDLYYDPDTIPAAHRHPFKQAGMLPGQAELAERAGLNPHLRNAIFENNLRNGVLTAVEDFVAAHPGELLLQIVPGFHGLGVLHRRSDVAANVPLRAALAALPAEGPDARHAARLEEARLAAELDRLNAERAAKAASENAQGKIARLRTELEAAQAEAAALRDQATADLARQRAEKAEGEAKLAAARRELEAERASAGVALNEAGAKHEAAGAKAAAEAGEVRRQLNDAFEAHKRQSRRKIEALESHLAAQSEEIAALRTLLKEGAEAQSMRAAEWEAERAQRVAAHSEAEHASAAHAAALVTTQRALAAVRAKTGAWRAAIARRLTEALARAEAMRVEAATSAAEEAARRAEERQARADLEAGLGASHAALAEARAALAHAQAETEAARAARADAEREAAAARAAHETACARAVTEAAAAAAAHAAALESTRAAV